MADRINLTQAAVTALLEQRVDRRTWDEKVRHLALRQRASGGASWVVVYRTTGGRRGSVREVTVGDARVMKPEVARIEARKIVGAAAEGRDPAAEKAAARAAMTVKEAVDTYTATLTNHRNQKTITSLLKRELVAQLGSRRLRDLTRADLIERISTVEQGGRRGAAEMLRRDTAVLLNWCANTGLIQASPLAGWRKPRATKAAMLEREGRAGRALSRIEVEALHAAREKLPKREATFLLLLLATAMRRQEAERARWSDITTDEHGAWLTIPAANAKNARAHRVFLVPTVVAALDTLKAETLATQERAKPVLPPFIYGRRAVVAMKIHGSDDHGDVPTPLLLQMAPPVAVPCFSLSRTRLIQDFATAARLGCLRLRLNDESQAEGIARLRNEMALATTTRTASGKERVVAAQDDVLMATGYLVWAASRFGHALRRGTALAPRPAEFSAAAWT